MMMGETDYGPTLIQHPIEAKLGGLALSLLNSGMHVGCFRATLVTYLIQNLTKSVTVIDNSSPKFLKIAEKILKIAIPVVAANVVCNNFLGCEMSMLETLLKGVVLPRIANGVVSDILGYIFRNKIDSFLSEAL